MTPPAQASYVETILYKTLQTRLLPLNGPNNCAPQTQCRVKIRAQGMLGRNERGTKGSHFSPSHRPSATVSSCGEEKGDGSSATLHHGAMHS